MFEWGILFMDFSLGHSFDKGLYTSLAYDGASFLLCFSK